MTVVSAVRNGLERVCHRVPCPLRSSPARRGAQLEEEDKAGVTGRHGDVHLSRTRSCWGLGWEGRGAGATGGSLDKRPQDAVPRPAAHRHI